MKKKVILLAALFAGATTFAQDLTSKKGETILPEADDWAISMDATPFLDFAGGFLGGNAVAPTANPVGALPFHIRGKMFVDANTAYRAGLRIGMGSDKTTAKVGQLNATAPTWPTLPTLVDDVMSQGATNVVLSGGLEKRRGNTRLQGYYGGELLIALANTKNTYTYGNAMDAAGTALALSTDFGMGNVGSEPFYGNPGRMTESKTSSFALGLRGFIGAEYFVFAKMSIGAEYGWGLGVSSSSTSSTWEATDGTAIATIVDETGNKSNSFGLDGDIMNNVAGSGSLNITFHF